MSEQEDLGFTDIPTDTDTDAGVGMLGEGESCAGEKRAAESIALDIHLMVDISASMLDVLPDGSGATKWDAVNGALQEFVQSPETEDIGIGLSYFPLLLDGVPDSCMDNQDCGDAAPCSSSWCVIPAEFDADTANSTEVWAVPLEDHPYYCGTDEDCGGEGIECEIVRGYCIQPAEPPLPADLLTRELDDGTIIVFPCASDAQCPVGADGERLTCESIGACSDSLANDEFVACSETFACPGGDQCESVPDVCLQPVVCDAGAYVPPSVPISAEAGRSDGIVDSLGAQELTSITPTAPALEGALTHAREWAEENPSHQVVTVLATDGFPTSCAPYEIEEIAQLASNAASSTPSIKTFVIGVFGELDLGTDGEDRLDTLAVAGGTQEAFVVNTGGDVTQEFLDALNLIRDTSISCEFQLPDMDNLDYDRVNLNVMDADGEEAQLINVGDETGCADDNDGWYYVVDGDGTPVEINVCPNICDVFTAGAVSAELEIGCETQTLLH